MILLAPTVGGLIVGLMARYKISDVVIRKPVVVHPGDTLRMVANLFAERHITSAPVVDSEDGGKVLGADNSRPATRRPTARPRRRTRSGAAF